MGTSIKSFLFAGLLMAVSAIAAVAQTDADKITPKESREANAFARKFLVRLLQTKDIKPLIREFFVKDFLQRVTSDEDADWGDFLRNDQVSPERRSQLARFYIAEINWFYLNMLNLYSKSTIDTDSNSDVDDAYFLKQMPLDVQAALRKDSHT